MKKIFLLLILTAVTFTQQLFAQDIKATALDPLLTSYYNIKDALTKSNSANAATSAGQFLKTVNAVDTKSLPVADAGAFKLLQDKLAFDARHMYESKDIAHQREHFASLSTNVFKLAKAAKLTYRPVYYDYCPMKKAYWLSADAEIKNPYFGSDMPDCGAVKEELNKHGK